jgi:predicted Rossmann fold flavoprotein
MSQIAVIGGGAAGFFAAIACAEANPSCRVTIFERGKNVLEKVRISGGRRCNVTHACFDAHVLVKNYPRGERELLGPFQRFGPQDTVAWFEQRGVRLKTEADGRMFPLSDDSASIVNCLISSAQKAGVRVLTGARVERFEPASGGGWRVWVSGAPAEFDKILVATGSSAGAWEQLQALGHPIVPPVPSLFTFNTKDLRLRELSGLTVPAVKLRVLGTKWASEGPLLVTHWGLSGPAILRLSAWGARDLHEMGYKFLLEINFFPKKNPEALRETLQQAKTLHAKKQVQGQRLEGIPQRLWQHLVEAAGIAPERRWADLTKAELQQLATQLSAAPFNITGKSTFKEEFVTAGGVSLKAIQFKTFESRVCSGLYLAGEVLDVDAITGGFNFQAAWTGGWLAGLAMADKSA